MYGLVVQSSGSQPMGQDSPKGNKINLRGREMVNGSSRKEEVVLILGTFLF